jgi:hypothetical protein
LRLGGLHAHGLDLATFVLGDDMRRHHRFSPSADERGKGG